MRFKSNIETQVDVTNDLRDSKEFDTDEGASTHLRVNADGLAALLAAVSEDALVALDAVGMLIAKHVSLAGQRLVALPAAEVATVPVLVHRLRVFATEN